MNKSLMTNIFSLGLIATGYFFPLKNDVILTMGLYSFSGAITNWLAIHMLFEKVPFLYGSGIVTERFEDFKLGIKNLIIEQFFNQENFERFMGQNSKSLIKIEEKAIVDSINFDEVFDKLKEAILESPFGGMLGMFGGPSALDPLRAPFEVKFKEVISDIVNKEDFIENLTKSSEGPGLDSLVQSVHSLIDKRLNELTPQMVKEIIQKMIKDHLGWLVVWGGVFGAVIGLLTTLI